MARYIDADWIYQMVEYRYRVSSGIEHRCERALLDLICEAPTADVAPKSEVAREIFEEINYILFDYESAIQKEYRNAFEERFAELKKKYTEEWK